jgi:hypothetical protein
LNALKEKLTFFPCLLSPDWNKPFHVYCDDLEVVVGSALCQCDENGDKLCDTMGSVDTSNCGNHAQLVLHYVFSFGIGFFGGSSICIS